MNRFRWVAFCVAGGAILTFTQFPSAATLQTRVDYSAADVNYQGTSKSNSQSRLADAAESYAK